MVTKVEQFYDDIGYGDFLKVKLTYVDLVDGGVQTEDFYANSECIICVNAKVTKYEFMLIEDNSISLVNIESGDVEEVMIKSSSPMLNRLLDLDE